MSTVQQSSFPSEPVVSSARLSPCRLYRYELWRKWADGPACVFIRLNPSTADETRDDPTIRKCIGYAKGWGYSALCMVNLFAFRATQPKDMLAVGQPVGPLNDEVLREVCRHAGIVIAAWGKYGTHLRRDRQVFEMIDGLHALKLNRDGTPAHPLYLRGDVKPFALATL